MLIILWKSSGSRDQKCVKMAIFVNIWENRINTFQNLLLQTHNFILAPKQYFGDVLSNILLRIWKPCALNIQVPKLVMPVSTCETGPFLLSSGRVEHVRCDVFL